MKQVTGGEIIESLLTIIKCSMAIPVVMSEVNIRVRTTVRYSEGERVIEAEGYLMRVFGPLSEYVCLDDGGKRVLCIPQHRVLTMRTYPAAQDCDDVILPPDDFFPPW